MQLRGTSNLDHQQLNMRHSTQGCAFGALNNVPLNFGNRTTKNGNFGHMNNNKNSNTYNLSTAEPIMTKFFTGDRQHEWAFVDGPTTSPKIQRCKQ